MLLIKNLLRRRITMQIIYTHGNHPDFITLCNQLDHSLDIAMGGFDKREKFVPFNQANTMDMVVMLYSEETPIACGAYRQYDNRTAEIKRMFVNENYRGLGYGRTILQELNRITKERHFQRLLLETGDFLTAAVALYKSMGFSVIPNYPPYEKMSESLCMELIIVENL